MDKDLIPCRSIYGDIKLINKNRLYFRPSVYGLILHEGKILLVWSKTAQKYAIPGGGVELGERLPEALKREVREETGIEIQVGEQVFNDEDFFYYDPKDIAFQSYRFVFLCQPLTFIPIADHLVQDNEVEKPRWIDIKALQADQFQTNGAVIMEILSKWNQ